MTARSVADSIDSRAGFTFCTRDPGIARKKGQPVGKHLNTTSSFFQNLGVTVFFSGILYNLPQLCQQHQIFPAAAGPLLAMLYRKHGLKTLRMLDGAFALAIYEDTRVYLARDREGLENLYYYHKHDRLIVSTTIENLQRLIRLQVDSEVLPRYFVLDQLNNEDTFFADVKQVRILDYLQIDLSTHHRQSVNYDPLPYLPLADKSYGDTEILNGLEDLLAAQIQSQLAAFPDHPVYNTQSGGTDSALTQCLLQKLGHKHSICANFEHFGSDAGYAQDVADHLKSEHATVTVSTADFVASMRAGIAAAEMPLIFEGEAMFKHMYGIIGNQTSPVICFDSTGADAILGHGRLLLALTVIAKAPRLFRAGQLLMAPLLPHNVRQLLPDLVQGARQKAFSPALFAAVFNLRQRLDITRRAFDLNQQALEALFAFELQEAEKYPVNLIEKVFRLQVFQYEVKRMNNLTYQLARQHNVIPLYPFRDRGLLEFMLNVPTPRKLRRGVQKYYGKKLLERYIPKAFIYRKKINKGIPCQRLFADDEQFRSAIAELRASDYRYFDFDLDTIFSTGGLEPFALKLINFHWWHEHFIRGQK